eukprot:gb/GECG01013180.1/.p1 GENE.gb/GECG01013180.1/~~gb/GECG01013180.1/.p1  ORF type:complete len:212 (+),score=30.30 gb/GECG01013180.1/:1-636(+)
MVRVPVFLAPNRRDVDTDRRNILVFLYFMQAEGTPEIRAVIVADSKGRRIAAKYFNKEQFQTTQEQHNFEKKLYQKTRNSQARFEAEVSLLEGNTVVYRLGDDVFFYVLGSTDENELILVSVLDAIYEALNSLLKHNLDKITLLENLELLLLCIDEVVEGGTILELDAEHVHDRVLMKGAVPEAQSTYSEMTMSSAVNAARDALARNFIKQ